MIINNISSKNELSNVKRRPNRSLTKERKLPNFSIPINKTTHIEYPVLCANNLSSISREMNIFIRECLDNDKIDDEYLEEPKSEKFSISIELSLIEKFAELCERYKKLGLLNYKSTPLQKRIEKQLREGKLK